MKKKSIWIDKSKDNQLPSLEEDKACDILIVGGGLAGLSVAYKLKDNKQKIILIDKDICGRGVTAHNTGKLTFMQDLIYSKLEKNYNHHIAKLYYDSQREAIDEVLKIIKENKISCHLVKTKAYTFSLKDSDYEDFNREISFYKDNNIKYKILSNLPVPFPSKYALETYDSYVFNPYEYLLGLKKILQDKINIYEKTRCIEVKKEENTYKITLENGHIIQSKIVIICSHYPMFLLPFLIPFKTKIEKFCIGASKCEDIKDVQLISHNKPSISMRYYKKDHENYFIYGRRSHSSGTNLDLRKDLKELEEEYQKYFGKKLDYFYHTHDIMTYDHLPFIGKIKDNLYLATGFNKWGNTNGTLSGIIISNMINKKENRYLEIFNPRRKISVDKMKNIPLYNIEVSSFYLLNKINPNKNYYNSNVYVETIDGKRRGVYIDDQGKKHIVSNICPHMKCNLLFNYVDKTWDCPCHGSRFDIDGNIIYGPSVFNIKLDNNK